MLEAIIIIISLSSGSVSLYTFVKAAQATVILHKK